jgi:hypothetical protein
MLATLYRLQKLSRMPKCTKKEFEDLMVEIAEMEIVKRARYKKLTDEEESGDVHITP